MKNTNIDILKAVAILSNYNWYKVTTNGGTMYATGINVYRDSFLKFDRQFATPVFTENSIIKVAALAENRIAFTDKAGENWTVEGSHNSTIANPDKAHGSAERPQTLIDWSRTTLNDGGEMLIVFDLRKLGRIDSLTNAKIKKYMNVNLSGQNRSNQKPRTIYIRTENRDSMIYMGLLALENGEFMTEGLYDLPDFTTADSAADQAEFEQMQKTRQLVAYVREQLENEEEDLPF